MIFRVRDLMVNVLPDTGTGPDDLLMCDQITTQPKPAPAPAPRPKPGPKHAEIADEGADWAVLAQLREQLHQALRC